MKFTMSWLKRHLDTNASAADIAEKLTAIGLEVEAMEDRAAKYAPFKVAYVEKAEQHPNADKLKVCIVKTETGTVQVVCGAPNARTGMKGIFAPEGSYIPGTDMTLKKGVIRGVESCGMLVSEREMGLSDDHDGIIDVKGDAKIGTPFAELYGLNDISFEVAITPNRADATAVRGIARDLAASGLGKLKKIDDKPVKGKFKSPISVSIQDTDGCKQFLGRYIKGVKNGPSPQWLQDLLKGAGLRPISALVDITNLMTLEYGRPLHVFDADKIKGNILVRETKKGETLEALNDKTYTLPAGACGVCDDSGIVGIGGIVGGVPTGCTEDTVNVFLEGAYFSAQRISRTGRDLEIISDARYRFERGIDPEFTAVGIEIATRLILELCGGTASNVVEAGSTPEWQRSIDFDPGYVQKLAGFDVPVKRQKEILESLGFTVTGKGPFKISPPSWRGDIEGRPDLVEEIIRISGYENIPETSVRNDLPVTHSAETRLLTRTRQARTALAARGMDECVTWSFMGKALASSFGSNDNALTLSNPISSELDQMRPSILPNLIEAAGKNHARGFSDVALYEVGPIFKGTKPDTQPYVAAGIRACAMNPRHWADPQAHRPVNAFDAKADALAVLESCGLPSSATQITRDAPSYYHPGRSGVLRLGPNVVASFGEIHPAILQDMGIKTPISGFEVFIQNIPEAKSKGTAKKLLQLSTLQPLARDFAFIVDSKVEALEIVKAAKSADKNLITDVQVFDVYQGKGVEDGKKSVAFSVTIQPVDKTLTDAEIEGICKKIVEAVKGKTGGSLRS